MRNVVLCEFPWFGWILGFCWVCGLVLFLPVRGWLWWFAFQFAILVVLVFGSDWCLCGMRWVSCDFCWIWDFPDLGVFWFEVWCFDFAFRLFVLGLFIWCFGFWNLLCLVVCDFWLQFGVFLGWRETGFLVILSGFGNFLARFLLGFGTLILFRLRRMGFAFCFFVVFIDFWFGWFGVFGLVYDRVWLGLVFWVDYCFTRFGRFCFGLVLIVGFGLLARWCCVVCDFVSFAFVLLFGCRRQVCVVVSLCVFDCLYCNLLSAFFPVTLLVGYLVCYFDLVLRLLITCLFALGWFGLGRCSIC